MEVWFTVQIVLGKTICGVICMIGIISLCVANSSFSECYMCSFEWQLTVCVQITLLTLLTLIFTR